jgi:hypothetical protein
VQNPKRLHVACLVWWYSFYFLCENQDELTHTNRASAHNSFLWTGEVKWVGVENQPKADANWVGS